MTKSRTLRRSPVGGSGGIRTHVPLRTTAFRVRLVMTTSILLHVFFSLQYAFIVYITFITVTRIFLYFNSFSLPFFDYQHIMAYIPIERNIMKLDIIVAYPAGNITIFVITPVSRILYQNVAEKLLSIERYHAEQVAFIMPSPEKKGSDGRIEMAGLEFCGNAARSFGLIIAKQQLLRGQQDFSLEGLPPIVLPQSI